LKEFKQLNGLGYILEQMKNVNIYMNAAFFAETIFGSVVNIPLTFCKSMVKKLLYFEKPYI